MYLASRFLTSTKHPLTSRLDRNTGAADGPPSSEVGVTMSVLGGWWLVST